MTFLYMAGANIRALFPTTHGDAISRRLENPLGDLDTHPIGAQPARLPSPDPLGYRALLDVLNRTQFGVIITADTSLPLFVNEYARRLINQGNPLRLAEGGLQAATLMGTRVLREAIQKACRRELTTCVTLMLSRSSADRPVVVHVPPPGKACAGSDLATLLLCDLNERAVVNAPALIRLFGLTRAEASLAAILMAGSTIEEAAGQLFVSIHTARTHLKRILLKTDTGRQAELLRLLLMCSGQVRLE